VKAINFDALADIRILSPSIVDRSVSAGSRVWSGSLKGAVTRVMAMTPAERRTAAIRVDVDANCPKRLLTAEDIERLSVQIKARHH
jgi:hypothetical protein